MDPLLDVGANGIEIIPKTENDIHVGDVISYKTESGIVIHRVVDIRSDEQGLYYVLKGDNNPVPDKERVRFKDIQGILVAVVY
jgi:signal peptidase I